MSLSPGLSYLLEAFPGYIGGACLSGIFFYTLSLVGLAGPPVWIVLLACLLTRPLIAIVLDYYIDYLDRKTAALFGATVVPTVRDKWPYSFTTVRRLQDNMLNGYPGDLYMEWKEKYGSTFTVLLPFERRVVTLDPEYIKEILALQFQTFEKGCVMSERERKFLGTGILNCDGKFWKLHHTIIRPFFNQNRVNSYKGFGLHADNALKQARLRLAKGYPVDIQDLISRFALDSSTEFLFGKNVKSLNDGLAYPWSSSRKNPPTFENSPSNWFMSAVEKCQHEVMLRYKRGEMWPLYDMFGDKITPNRKIINQLIGPLVRRAIKRKQRRKGDLNEDEAECLLDYMVHNTENQTLLMDEVLNLLVAGRETSTSLMTFSVYMMAEYPTVTRRLRQEIIKEVGPTNEPTSESIRELKYLRAFINEVLRLYPPIPFNNRTSTVETTLPPKAFGKPALYIPALTRCEYSVFMVHRSTELWGIDALEFDPDRFIDERSEKYKVSRPYAFCPFNAGPRICLGQQFAYQEASVFIVKLLQRFSEITLALDAQPRNSIPPKEWAGAPGRKGLEKVIPQVHMTMQVKGGLWVRMQEADPDGASN